MITGWKFLFSFLCIWKVTAQVMKFRHDDICAWQRPIAKEIAKAWPGRKQGDWSQIPAHIASEIKYEPNDQGNWWYVLASKNKYNKQYLRSDAPMPPMIPKKVKRGKCPNHPMHLPVPDEHYYSRVQNTKKKSQGKFAKRVQQYDRELNLYQDFLKNNGGFDDVLDVLNKYYGPKAWGPVCELDRTKYSHTDGETYRCEIISSNVERGSKFSRQTGKRKIRWIDDKIPNDGSPDIVRHECDNRVAFVKDTNILRSQFDDCHKLENSDGSFLSGKVRYNKNLNQWFLQRKDKTWKPDVDRISDPFREWFPWFDKEHDYKPTSEEIHDALTKYKEQKANSNKERLGNGSGFEYTRRRLAEAEFRGMA